MRPTALRSVGLGLLAFGELLWLSIRIDTACFSGMTSWWAGPLSYSNRLISIVLVSVSFIAIIAGAFPQRALNEIESFPKFPPRSGCLVPAQIASFLIFARMSIFLVEGELGSSPFPKLWFLAWAGTGLTTVLFWLGAMMPLGNGFAYFVVNGGSSWGASSPGRLRWSPATWRIWPGNHSVCRRSGWIGRRWRQWGKRPFAAFLTSSSALKIF